MHVGVSKHNDDGADAHQTHMTNTANAPIVENCELEHLCRLINMLWCKIQGACWSGGGLGLIKEKLLACR